MAKFFRKTTSYLQTMAKFYRFFAIFSLFSIPFTLLWLVVSLNGKSTGLVYLIVFSIYLIILSPLLFAHFLQYKEYFHQANSYLSGLRGEEITEKELKRILGSKDFSVFQNVIIKKEKGNIDFVVVGPNGVFTLEVKNHRGRIDFDGNQLTRNGKRFEKDFLMQAMAEAWALHNFLNDKLGVYVFITPVIVFSNYFADLQFGLNPERNVFVIRKTRLGDLFRSQDRYLNDYDRKRIEMELQSVLSFDSSKGDTSSRK